MKRSAHLDTEGIGIAGGQAPHAVVGEAIVQLAHRLRALLLAAALQRGVVAIGAVLHHTVCRWITSVRTPQSDKGAADVQLTKGLGALFVAAALQRCFVAAEAVLQHA